jgi:glycosyltransferase involved in cell wall biosynthesis
MPVSVVEAMAKSLPVMAAAIGGTSDEVATTGHLLPDPAVDDARTIASLIDVLERWALDEDLRHEIRAEGRRRAERMFTRDRMVADHLRVVEELLGDGSMAALASKWAYKGARS